MSDWTTQAADVIENTVAAVRDKTVAPAQGLAKALVYGLLGGAFLTAAAILAAIGAFRALAVYVPGHTWAAYLIVGGISTLGGLLLWARRTPRSS